MCKAVKFHLSALCLVRSSCTALAQSGSSSNRFLSAEPKDAVFLSYFGNGLIFEPSTVDVFALSDLASLVRNGKLSSAVEKQSSHVSWLSNSWIEPAQDRAHWYTSAHASTMTPECLSQWSIGCFSGGVIAISWPKSEPARRNFHNRFFLEVIFANTTTVQTVACATRSCLV